MNIFWLAFVLANFRGHARMLCDQHVVKMCTEAAQVAYTTLHVLFETKMEEDEKTRKKIEETYKSFMKRAPPLLNKDGETVRHGYSKTHVNHPVCIWSRAKRANFAATVSMCDAICDEYEARYSRVHAIKEHAAWLLSIVDHEAVPFPDGDTSTEVADMSEPPMCMPDEYKEEEGIGVVEAYRRYYVGDKMKWARYWYCDPPEWVKPHLHREQYDKEYATEKRKLRRVDSAKAKRASKPKAVPSKRSKSMGEAGLDTPRRKRIKKEHKVVEMDRAKSDGPMTRSRSGLLRASTERIE